MMTQPRRFLSLLIGLVMLIGLAARFGNAQLTCPDGGFSQAPTGWPPPCSNNTTCTRIDLLREGMTNTPCDNIQGQFVIYYTSSNAVTSWQECDGISNPFAECREEPAKCMDYLGHLDPLWGFFCGDYVYEECYGKVKL